MKIKDKLVRDKLVKKWQRRLGLDDWHIYVIEETKEVMTKHGKIPGIRGDMYQYPKKKIGFIRHITWSKLKKEEKEIVLVHELLHFIYPEDSEKVIDLQAREAVSNYKNFMKINNGITDRRNVFLATTLAI